MNSLAPQNSSAEAQGRAHDEPFYFQNIVFQAEDTLFRVPTYAFPADEGIFASMFLLPKGDSEPEGSSDKNPICLPPDVSAFDFRSLLKACLPKPARVPQKLGVDEWMSALRLSTMWCLDDIRAASASAASPVVTALGPVEKLVLAKQYSISQWLIEAVEELAKRNTGLSVEEGSKIGLQSTLNIGKLREQSWSWTNEQWDDESRRPEYRLKYDFRSAIHDIFKNELTLDKDYSPPVKSVWP